MNSQNVDSAVLEQAIPSASTPDRGVNGMNSEGSSEEVDLDALLDYRSVPPRRVVTMSVHYRQLGRGRPLPSTLEEDNGG
jgi:hypothetical protein